MKSNDISSIILKKRIKSSGKNILNFNQTKDNLISNQEKKSKEGTPNKYQFENNKLIDSMTSLKSKFSMIKNTDLLKKPDTNLNRNNPNQRSFNNLKVTTNLDNFKFANSNNSGQGNGINSNTIRTSSNFKQNTNFQSSSNFNKKTSDNLFLINNNSINLFNNNLGNNMFEKPSMSQLRSDQYGKTSSSKPLDVIIPESERNSNQKSPKTKKNNNFLEENKKSEFPNLYFNNNQEENDMKKWMSDKNNNGTNQENTQKSLRVTLNKNFSKGNLMSAKLFESSQSNSHFKNNINSSINSSNSNNNNFPKIKSFSTIDPDKRESSPLSESDSLKMLKQLKNEKITVNERKTNSVFLNRKDDSNLSKYNSESKRDARNEANTVSSIIRIFCVKTRAGVNYDGTRKTNQDNFISKTNLLNLEDYHVFGVFDGHGLHGHFVSTAVKQFFSDYYNRIEIYSNRSHKFTKSTVKEAGIYERMKENNYEFLKTSFMRCEQELTKAKFEVNFSGTTCVLALLLGFKLIIANAGDSRALMVIKKSKSSNEDFEEKEYEPIQLSRDHKPDLEDEKERILACNGRVDKYTDNGLKSGPYRVWLKNENFPGLAMSRSIGDFVAGSVGCISEPEINEYEISNESKYIVIASDGVWEFLSNKRVMEIVSPFYKINDPASAAEKLVEESTKCWKKEDDVVDDITAVVIFFNKI